MKIIIITFYPIKKTGSINQQIYKQIRSTGAKCGVAYGLTKVHKQDLAIRPISSTIGTYNYDTAKHLTKVLDSNFSKLFNYALKDSFDFINEISKIKLEENDLIISIDVVSLFTNVPIN